MVLACRVVNERVETVIAGTATVIAPTEKINRPRIVPPTVELHEPVQE